MTDTIRRVAVVPPELAGQRLDQVAASLFPEFSRSRLQSWIQSGALVADGAVLRTRDKIRSGVELRLEATPEPVDSSWQAEARPLAIVHEDDDLLVVNKPAGLVVHPAAGHREGTLLNALLHHCPVLESIPRAGIVHRLDKDTTGLMVVAKNLTAQHRLVAQLQARTVHRQYDAVVAGVLTGGGRVDAPMGRHPRDRKRMAVLEHGGKPAVTHYRVQSRFRGHSHITCLLETGRTHQIRVHMAHLRYPLVGDPVYGGRPRPPAGALPELVTALQEFPRQALHARRLELVHPASGEPVAWEVALPEDMVALLAALRADVEASEG
ncbi:MAG: 23S rRNA pseudouridine(1911/1915/1917) synthase RluD [Spongiibacteraceae bacterium]|jgi:23S rRNA pseudouridine1911/1915/1917 synthase|nr:23S rRNA pseudouridine(1911/1915/1917) synthase RluD [Spongiibacteraceae bacterium]